MKAEDKKRNDGRGYFCDKHHSDLGARSSRVSRAVKTGRCSSASSGAGPRSSDRGGFVRATNPDPDDDAEPRVIFGETCFAELRPDSDDQGWSVKKYDSEWSFYLHREENVVEPMRRLDAREVVRQSKPRSTLKQKKHTQS
jgi:hypothetical protein